jgi:AAA family ATP:ADP antiporter
LMTTAGPVRLLIGGAVIVVVCVLLARLANRLTVRTADAQTAAVKTDEKLGEGKSGFSLLFEDRYLLLIALLILVLNVVNTSGEYLFGKYVEDAAKLTFGAGDEATAARGQFIGEAYSSFYGHVNLLGLLLQMFVVSRLFKFLGVGRSLFVHPFVAGAGYLMMLVSPSFGAIRVLKTADNAIDYSLGNTTKQALWLPTSRQAKYKAKQAVDSFFMRAGDVVSAAIVYVGDQVVHFAPPVFAALNLALTAGWIAIAAALNRWLKARADAGHGAL